LRSWGWRWAGILPVREKSDERKFSPPSAATPFHHIALKIDKATQEVIERRAKAAGYKNPDT